MLGALSRIVMAHPDPLSTPPAPWHVLFAPVPDGLVPIRKPVAAPEIMESPAGAATAEWEQLTLEISAGSAGARILLVTLDATGQAIAASDWVLYRIEREREPGDDIAVEYRHETVGGRFETDGSFAGTRWLTVTAETHEGEQRQLESTSSRPTAADEDGLRSVVAEMLRRAPATHTPSGP
jgi:hypothetical protein